LNSNPTYNEYRKRIWTKEFKFISQHTRELNDEFVRIEQQLNGKNLSCPEQVSMDDLKSYIEPLTKLHSEYKQVLVSKPTKIDERVFVAATLINDNYWVLQEELHEQDELLYSITNKKPIPRFLNTIPTTTMNSSRFVAGKQRKTKRRPIKKTKRRRIKKTKRSRRKY